MAYEEQPAGSAKAKTARRKAKPPTHARRRDEVMQVSDAQQDPFADPFADEVIDKNKKKAPAGQEHAATPNRPQRRRPRPVMVSRPAARRPAVIPCRRRARLGSHRRWKQSSHRRANVFPRLPTITVLRTPQR